ncbi:MAG: hypothetical protein SCH98_05320 [Deferrisomatales bacterium]|nr:hypothetical protein [Deferrisomatales bacterium]
MSVRLFVGNLSFDVTEAELKELFSASGSPSYVRIPTDRETGKPRGFAFVEFGDRAQAEDAIRRFHQQLFKGRPLAVNEARAREEGAAPRPPPRPGPRSGPGQPTEDLAGGEASASPGQPRGTFGPDARPRNRRKREGQGLKDERAPKGPLRERNTGQLFFAGDENEETDDAAIDDFALWRKEASQESEED